MATVNAVTPNESVENHLRSSIHSTSSQDSMYSPKKVGTTRRVYSSSKTTSPYQKSNGGAVGAIKKAGSNLVNQQANRLRSKAIDKGVDAGAVALSAAATDVGLGFASPLILGARKPLKKILKKSIPKFNIHF